MAPSYKKSQITLAYVIIALVAIGLLISLFSTNFPKLSTDIYCQLYQAANAISFLGPRPALPVQCSYEPRMERKTLSYDTFTKFKNDMYDHIIGCWRKAQYGATGFTFVCFELFIGKTPNNFTEADMTGLLLSKNYCDILPNNFLDLYNISTACGDKNKIIWQHDIGPGTYVIKYDALRRVIVVT